LAAKGLEGLLATPVRLARRLEQAIQHPQATVRQVAEAVEGVGEIGWAFANPAPTVPLNADIGSHRRFTWVRSDLGQMKRIKNELGGTVNDVVLAVVAGAIRDWLRSRHSQRGLELRARSRSRSAPRASAASSATAGRDAHAAARLHPDPCAASRR
jgi:hypothetical protein